MYKLMVVDDEPFIADGLADLFSQLQDPVFEVFVAYSAQSALAQLDRQRMDLVISDIKMPKMTGLEMLAQVKERWPFCHVIFLSGYSDFDYVQQALSYGADAYLLKNQSDEAILEAVLETVRKIESEQELAQLQQQIEARYEYALPVLRRDFLHRYLHEEAALPPAELETRLKELRLTLRSDAPVMLISARLDQPGAASEEAAQADAVFTQWLSPKANTICLYEGSRYLYWILQKKSQILSYDTLYLYLSGSLEKVQLRCSQLGLPISFVWDPVVFSWEQLPGAYDRLRSIVTFFLDPKAEMILCDTHSFHTALEKEEVHLNKSNAGRIQDMRTALEYRQKEPFLLLLDKILSQISDDTDPICQITAYHSLCTLFLDWILSTGQKHAYLQKFGSFSIFSLPYDQWSEAMVLTFREIAAFLFDGCSVSQVQRFSQIIQTLHQYIGENLEKDLTLTALAAQVYLNPVYLSRAYRQATGRKLSEYVLECRIREAKKLLKGRELKINEIAFAVGFDSAAHFSRVFKKVTSLTPQEYREGTAFL